MLVTLTHRAGIAMSVLTVLIVGCGSAVPATTQPTASPAGVPTPTGPVATPTTTPPATQPTEAPASVPDLGGLIPTDPALLTGVVPAGWQIIEDQTEACRMAAPPDWATDVLPGSAQIGFQPEALAGISANSDDWETFTASVDQFYLTGHVTLIDTPDAFLIANPAGPDFDFSYVLVRRFDDTNCMISVTVQRNWITQHAAPAALIATTLAPAD
jgi:hypothetical protein